MWSGAKMEPWETITEPWLLPCEQNNNAPMPDVSPETGDGASAGRFFGGMASLQA